MHWGMVVIHEHYTREMNEEYGYFVVWLPSMQVAIGDVSTFTRHRFEKVTAPADLGIRFQVTVSGPRADLEYKSSGAVSGSGPLDPQAV
jgi:hypothetical protein